jgi:hypothetical protein
VADAEAQMAFWRRVMLKPYEPFTNPPDLVARVSRKLYLWSESGSRGIARRAQLNVGSRASRRQPSEDEIRQLGRKEQIRELQDNLDIVIGRGFSNVICFLVSGRSNYGQTQLVERLCKELEAGSQAHQYKISLSPLWRQKTSTRLFEVIGSSMQPDWIPTSTTELADRLREILKETDVVLKIDRIDRLHESPATFAEEFWKPLALALNGSLTNRLTLLVTAEGALSPEWEQYLQPSLEEDALDFDPTRIVRLAELQAFSKHELEIWLRKGKWVEEQDVSDLANALIDETAGIPQLLYLKLADDATWNY